MIRAFEKSTWMDYHIKRLAVNITLILKVFKGRYKVKVQIDQIIIYSFYFFKGPREILEDEQKKRPCGKFSSGNCQFGATCRFSHYTPAQLAKIQERGRFM